MKPNKIPLLKPSYQQGIKAISSCAVAALMTSAALWSASNPLMADVPDPGSTISPPPTTPGLPKAHKSKSGNAPIPSAPVNNNQIPIDLVTVGDPGNQADMNGKGAVSTSFQLGKYDVTADQYCQFLNAVAAADPHGLYDPRMHTDSYVNLIEQTVNDDGSYSYTVNPDRKNYPIVYVRYERAQRFCNWLQNGQPTGVEDDTTTEDGAYNFVGASDGALGVINDNAVWRLPTDDEWYKAAYYKGGVDGGYWKYPTQSNKVLSNETTEDQSANYGNRIGWNHLTAVGSYTTSPGVYGTFDMGGDVNQWTSDIASVGGVIIRGGDWMAPAFCSWNPAYKLCSDFYDVAAPDTASSTIGFRVVGPTPDTTVIPPATDNGGNSVAQPEDSINYASLAQANSGAAAPSSQWTTGEEIGAIVATVAAVAAAGYYGRQCYRARIDNTDVRGSLHGLELGRIGGSSPSAATVSRSIDPVKVAAENDSSVGDGSGLQELEAGVQQSLCDRIKACLSFFNRAAAPESSSINVETQAGEVPSQTLCERIKACWPSWRGTQVQQPPTNIVLDL